MKQSNSILIFSGLALALNLIWEFSHYRLYTDLSGIPGTLHLVVASFTDMLILAGIAGLVSLNNKNTTWLFRQKKSDYVTLVILTLAVAATIEIVNLSLGRWAYTHAMPTIFGIGLSPLLQLAVTGTVSLFITGRFSKR